MYFLTILEILKLDWSLRFLRLRRMNTSDHILVIYYVSVLDNP